MFVYVPVGTAPAVVELAENLAETLHYKTEDDE